jgi:macrolide phosphotransferase
VWQSESGKMAPYPRGMSHQTLMLAAHASAAVPDMQLVRTTSYNLPGVEAAVGWDESGEAWLIELPQTDEAESRQRDRVAGARAIGDGLRSRLPFDAPRVEGTTTVQGRTLSVGKFLPGDRVRTEKTTPDVAEKIGQAIAHLHQIPASALYDQGRPVLSSNDSMRKATSIVDRAAQTTLLPKALLRRWEAAYEDHDLWQFEPTIIHGALHLGAFLVDAGEVAAVTGWREFGVGDPARDLAWFTTPQMTDKMEPGRTRYLDTRSDADRRIFQRARFWAELDIARWLLHGIDHRNEKIVDEATQLINELHERISDNLDTALTEVITDAPHPLSGNDDRG